MQNNDWVGQSGWLREPERACAARLNEAFEAMFEEFGVKATPLLALRTEDVIVSYLHVRQAEARLAQIEAQDDGTSTKSPVHAAFEEAAKARERMRKAMKDLEDYCSKIGSPIDKGLAEVMQPILAKAEGVIEDALAFEAAKRGAYDDA